MLRSPDAEKIGADPYDSISGVYVARAPMRLRGQPPYEFIRRIYKFHSPSIGAETALYNFASAPYSFASPPDDYAPAPWRGAPFLYRHALIFIWRGMLLEGAGFKTYRMEAKLYGCVCALLGAGAEL